MFAPETDIKFLANCDVDPGQNNVRDFADKAEQAKYFSSKAKISLPKCAVMDIVGFSGVIKAPLGGGITIDSYYNCNYLMYRNSGISGKWFYAYLGTPQILNSGVALIPYSIDQWQTWCYDINIAQCFVDREIPADDTIGKNLYAEDVDTGEFVLCEEDSGGYDIAAGITQTASNKCVLIAYSFSVSEDADTTYFVEEVQNGLRYEFPGLKPVFSGGYLDSGVYQANLYIWVDVSDSSTVDKKITLLNSFIEKTIGEGQIDKIKYVKMVPRVLCEGLEYTGGDTTPIPPNSIAPKNIPRFGKECPTKFGAYTPECNKLYTQQFNYFVVSNGGGSTIDFGYEYFCGNTPKFTLYTMAGDNPTILLSANGYKCAENNDNMLYTLTISDFPSGSISVSSGYNEYNASVARNRWVTQGLYDLFTHNLIEEGAKVSGNIAKAFISGLDPSQGFFGNLNGDGLTNATKNAIGGAYTGAAIGRSAIQTYADSLVNGDGALPYPRKPNSIVGASGTDIPFAIGVKTFSQYRLQVQEQYARKIDNYFKSYGYKTNQFKIPDTTSRPKWNYVKCVNPVINGNIPMEAKQAISQMLTNGLRFWHSGAVWMDYSQKNK